jgi:WD40 repeat protein/serine/threonine protein kinase
MSDATADGISVEMLAEEFLERKRRGEKPSVAEYLGRHPHLADEIRDFFPVLGLVEDYKPGSGDATGSFGGAEIPGLQKPLQRLGDYRILRMVGSGGMGVVYEAEQESLGRRVALKVMAGQRLSDPSQLARFTREAKAAARLHHTNIVPVFGVGEADGVHYYAMQFIHGQGLDAVLRELERLEAGQECPAEPTVAGAGDVSAVSVALSLRAGRFALAGVTMETDAELFPEDSNGPRVSEPTHVSVASAMSSLGLSGQSAYVRSVARISQQAAEGLAYAHEQGILHRDVKPSNLLLDAHGVLWITDFGLAKATTDSNLTHTGDILGTIRYMAPERFHGKCDARSDIYALGLTLYELLAKRPAFEEVDRGRLLNQVTTAKPRPLQHLDREIPRDLVTIVQKAVEREPSHRYQTAAEMANDLRRFLEDRPIAARPITAAEQLWRWCKRNPLAAGLAACLLASLVIGLVAVSGLFVNLRTVAEERRRLYLAERERSGQLRIAEALANRRYYIARMNLVQRFWEDNGECEGFLNTLAQQLPEYQLGIDRRGWEWHFWQRKLATDHVTLNGHAGVVNNVAFSPDGTRVASVGDDQLVKVWDVPTGHESFTLKGHTAPLFGVAFSPDGKKIASAGQDQTLKLWDASSQLETLTLKGHTGTVYGVAFSPDGKRIASASEDKTVRLWDAKTGFETLTLKGHTREVHGVAFSPDGSHIASASRDRTVVLWDSASGLKTLTLNGHSDGVFAVAFSPDGSHAASASYDRTVKVWSATTGQETLTFREHSGSVNCVAFSPDGSCIASAGDDRKVRVWDAATGREVDTLTGNSGYVYGVAFSPDGSRIASAGNDRTVKVWYGGVGREELTLKGHSGWVHAVAFSPDGSRIASAGRDRTVKVWNATAGHEELTLRGHTSLVFDVAFSPDGSRIASASNDRTMKIWDAATGLEMISFNGDSGDVHGVAFNRDGTRVASAGDDRTVKVWDAASGHEVFALEGHLDRVRSVAFSPDGTRVVSAGDDRTVRVWDVARGKAVFRVEGHGRPVLQAVFSLDGSRIASAGADQTVCVWDSATGQRVLALKGHTGWVASAAFSPDGLRIASAGVDRTVRIWDGITGQETLRLEGHTGSIYRVAFSPDGSRIVSSSEDGTVRVWDAGEATPAIQVRDEARRLIGFLIDRLTTESDLRERIASDKSRSAAVRSAALDILHGFWQARIRDRAEAIVKPLFQRLSIRDAVLDGLRADPAADPEIQAACVKLAETWPETAVDFNNGGWLLVREPGRSAESYAHGLRAAREACRLVPDSWEFLNTLGVAQYRNGLVTEAVATLRRSNALHGANVPADLAFLAMAHQRLAQAAEARTILDRLRVVMRQSGNQNPENLAFLAEAEAVIQYDSVFPGDPFAP